MTSPAVASLVALIAAIALSMTTRINVGLVSIVFAWLVGTYVAGMSTEAIVRGFPSGLFLTLAGMSVLFAAAETNGTLERLAMRATRLTKGRAALLPLAFFAVACAIAAVGPGAVSSVALVAPLAMAIGGRAGVPPLLTALMVANGANAGNLSPISAVGVIANAKMTQAGIGGHAGKVMLANLFASSLVALVAYVSLGGPRLAGNVTAEADDRVAFDRRQALTLAVLATWIVLVVALGINPGLAALAGAVIVVGAGAAAESPSIARVPWGVILMVCGVSTLIALLETTGGMELFTALLARLASPATANGVIALVTGAISLYSSTSGVVMPAFLPTAGSLAERVGGDPLAIALSINVGSSLVDISPLSTIGALCLAAVPDQASTTPLFRRLMLWGFAMVLAGALLCQLLAGPFARV